MKKLILSIISFALFAILAGSCLKAQKTQFDVSSPAGAAFSLASGTLLAGGSVSNLLCQTALWSNENCKFGEALWQ